MKKHRNSIEQLLCNYQLVSLL